MKLKIITYNIRVESAERFEARAGSVADMINHSGADIVCFQELADDMQHLLMSFLPEYIFVGGFRDADRSGEGAVIAFKKDRFYLSDCRTHWMSHTPLVPGSRFDCDQSLYPRVYTAVTLTEYDTFKTFRVYNTHFDHRGCDARLLEAEQILSAIAEDSAYVSYPIIFTGDLNSTPNVPTIDMIKRVGGLIDVTSQIKQSFTNDHTPYDSSWQGDKIDYIFVSSEIASVSCTRVDGDDVGTCGSDHYAIKAVLTF